MHAPRLLGNEESRRGNLLSEVAKICRQRRIDPQCRRRRVAQHRGPSRAALGRRRNEKGQLHRRDAGDVVRLRDEAAQFLGSEPELSIAASSRLKTKMLTM